MTPNESISIKKVNGSVPIRTKYLEYAINSNGFNRPTIASYLGVSNGYLSKVFNNKFSLPFNHFYVLLRKLNLEMDRFVDKAKCSDSHYQVLEYRVKLLDNYGTLEEVKDYLNREFYLNRVNMKKILIELGLSSRDIYTNAYISSVSYADYMAHRYTVPPIHVLSFSDRIGTEPANLILENNSERGELDKEFDSQGMYKVASPGKVEDICNDLAELNINEIRTVLQYLSDMGIDLNRLSKSL